MGSSPAHQDLFGGMHDPVRELDFDAPFDDESLEEGELDGHSHGGASAAGRRHGPSSREGVLNVHQEHDMGDGSSALPTWVPYGTKAKRTVGVAPVEAAFEMLVRQLIEKKGLERAVAAIYQPKNKKDPANPPTQAEEKFGFMFRKLLREAAMEALKRMREAEPGKRPPESSSGRSRPAHRCVCCFVVLRPSAEPARRDASTTTLHSVPGDSEHSHPRLGRPRRCNVRRG